MASTTSTSPWHAVTGLRGKSDRGRSRIGLQQHECVHFHVPRTARDYANSLSPNQNGAGRYSEQLTAASSCFCLSNIRRASTICSRNRATVLKPHGGATRNSTGREDFAASELATRSQMVSTLLKQNDFATGGFRHPQQIAANSLRKRAAGPLGAASGEPSSRKADACFCCMPPSGSSASRRDYSCAIGWLDGLRWCCLPWCIVLARRAKSR